MHEAYNVQSGFKAKSIASLAAYDNNIIYGTNNGELFMYAMDVHPAKMLARKDNFSKKHIVQMAVVAQEHLLFVLCDEMIHIFEISEEGFEETAKRALDTKGCNLFSIDAKTETSSSGEKTTMINICCAIKRHLRFFCWKMDRLEYLRYSIELKDTPKALSWVDDAVCVGFKDEYIIYNTSTNEPNKCDGIMKSSRPMEPYICVVKNNILCVSKNNFLMPIDRSLLDDRPKTVHFAEQDEKPKMGPITWSGNLMDLVWDEPYALGCLPNCIEVRSLDSSSINQDSLIQSIKLSKIKFLVRSGKGIIFAATANEIWCIRMEDLKRQVQELLQQEKFQLAIELTNISAEPEDKKSASRRQIHMHSAKRFFKSKLFAEAMFEFIEAQADPCDVIRLYPNLWPEKKTAALPTTEEARPKMKQLLEERDMEKALLALIDYLKWARRNETKKPLLSILSTTLLKCYLETNDSLVPNLLETRQCHFDESERTLKKYNKIGHLLILYKKYGKHKKALELLQSQSSIEGSSLYGYEHIIEYLQGLGSSRLPLIFEFSDWVLQQQPDEGLQIFTKNLIKVENLPRPKILDFLLKRHPDSVIPYLEHVIHVWNYPNQHLHNGLIKQYCEKIQGIMNEMKTNSSDSNELVKTYRGKLYDLLKNSNNYSPDVVLKEIPTNIMLEERALILGRLKKHEEVLAIYIQILGDIEKASQYCEENYNDDNNIFLLLLKTILNPLKQPPYEGIALHPDFIKPNHDIVLNLLNKYAEKINPHKVWPYLPDDLPLHRLKHYLNTVLRTEMAAAHQNQIKEGLMLAEILRLQNLVQEEENKSVEINENSLCPDCKKRFPTKPYFVRYPNGQVVHLSCHYKRESNSNA